MRTYPLPFPLQNAGLVITLDHARYHEAARELKREKERAKSDAREAAAAQRVAQLEAHAAQQAAQLERTEVRAAGAPRVHRHCVPQGDALVGSQHAGGSARCSDPRSGA
jgi:hypothetical protein